MKKLVVSISAFFLLTSYAFGQADTAAPRLELDSLLKVADALTEIRDFEKAEETLAKAEKLARAVFGEGSAAYGDVCFQYGTHYHFKGMHSEVEKWLLKCKHIREGTVGTETPEYALCLYRLGFLFFHMGNNYETAEKYYLQAKGIQERTIGKEHKDYASTMNSLGNMYYYTGNIPLAEAYYIEAKQIRERVLGKENILYSGSLNNLANIRKLMGKYEEAAELYQENIAIIERTKGKNNFYYAGGIQNLAAIYALQHDFERAKELLYQSKRILEGLPDYTGIPVYMSLMEAMGIFYEQTKQYDQAIAFHERSRELREKGLGKDHLSVEMSLAALSVLYWRVGKNDSAARCFSEASVMRRKFLSDATRHFSEKEVFDYTASFENELDKHLSFEVIFSKTGPGFSGTCYDNTLFYKGFLLSAASRFRNADLNDPGFAAKLEAWKSYQAQLAAEHARPAMEKKKTYIDSLETQANTLEKDLARTVAGFGEAIRQVSWQEVQAALKPGEAVLEFVHFNYYNPDQTDSTLYACLLLAPGMLQPLFIPLFEEKSLERLLPPPGKNRSEYVSNLYQNPALANLIWSPIEPYLQGVTRIFYAPSGLLHRLNLAALPQGTGTVLSANYDFVRVGSSRQLVNPAAKAGAAADAVLFGGIQYDMDSTAIAPMAADELAVNIRGLAFSDTDSTLRGGSWKYLKNSEKETANVAAILEKAGIPATAFSGYAATEEAFKRMGRQGNAPRILHLSTHGYFFPDTPLPTKGANAPTSTTKGSGAGELVFKTSHHPMIRSGLILAGANLAWQTGRPLGLREDGILTAYEISQLDLRNTELVVLSACETGLGDIRGNEGVFGLQRAFKIAGAKNLIMSLWQVPDFQTQELMTLFYQKWLLEKLTVHKALDAAQKEMRLKGYEPFFWAGFVLVE